MLGAMIRTAPKEGSPGDDKIRFVFQVASDETSCSGSGRRAIGEKDQDKYAQGTDGRSRLDWSQSQQ